MTMKIPSKELWHPVKRSQRWKDRLSSLPEHILVDILSLLPLKSVIVTSVLSRRWQHLWTQITSFIVIDEDDIQAYDEKFKQLTSSSIIRLEIDLSSRTSLEGWIRSIIELWIIEVCARNVERIKLSMVPPPCVFVTKSIVELDIKCLISLPDMIDLPNLKKLSIRSSTLTDESFETLFLNFINSCSLLKDLCLNIDILRGGLYYDVEIRLPNLKRLDMDLGHFFSVCVIDAPNLEYLYVNRIAFRFVQFPKALRTLQLDNVPCKPPQERIGSVIESWLVQVCSHNIERIKVSMPFGWELPPCVFLTKSLVELDLQFISLLNLPNMTDLPNLKKLCIWSTVTSSLPLFAKFINSCSLVEDLCICIFLEGTDLFSDVDIRLPNLKRLDIKLYHYNGVFVIDAPNLEYVSVRSPMKCRFVQVSKALLVTRLQHYRGDYILKSISQCVRSLQLDRVPCELQETFPYLTCLNVDKQGCDFDGLMKFLKLCPVLEVIRLSLYLWGSRTVDWELNDWCLWRLEKIQTNTKKIEIELGEGGKVLEHQTQVVKMVEYLVRSVNKDLKQLTLRASIYDFQATSFSTFGKNLVKCLVKVKRLSKYEMNSSNISYWSFVAWF